MSGAVKFCRDILRHKNAVLEGTVLCLDPASGGTSQPGWAYISGGELVASGSLALCKGDITDRLVDLLEKLSYPLFKYGSPDLLVIEELRGRMVHPYLHWSAGVTVVAVNAEAVLEIPITCWKAFAAADPNYAKGDEADARAFAHACIGLARGEPLPYRSRAVGKRMGRTDRAPAAKGRARAKRATAAGTSRVRATKRPTKGKRTTRGGAQ